MSKLDKIYIFDTTLRDGEQAPGASMQKDEKLKIACLLDLMGVDIIEAGFPASSQGDLESVQLISSMVQNATVAGLCRAVRSDIDACVVALKSAKQKRIHTFISTSALHMEHKLRMTSEQVHSAIVDSISYARNFCDDIEFSCEDGTRSNRDFLCRCFESAIKAGATTINIADTVGFTMPDEFSDLIKYIMNRVPNIDRARFSVHCHDDLGMGVANSLAAINSGVRQVEVTINGIGERAGNAALEEVVMALAIRQDIIGCYSDIKTEYLSEISQLVSTISGFQVPPNKAIVGANVFSHESGIHQDGMIKHRGTYEIIQPATVGVSQSTLVMGRHSGRHAFRIKLRELEIKLSEIEFERAFESFKSYADTKKFVTDDEIFLLIKDQIIWEKTLDISLKIVLIHSHFEGPQFARLSFIKNGVLDVVEASGVNPFEAIVSVFHKIYPHKYSLSEYEANSISENGRAFAKATVTLQKNHNKVCGQAIDEDSYTAFAEAYLDGLKKIINLSQP